MGRGITWNDRVRNLRRALGREPVLDELLVAGEIHQMTPAEREAQRESFARAMAPCEHGHRDWETCPACRALSRNKKENE